MKFPCIFLFAVIFFLTAIVVFSQTMSEPAAVTPQGRTSQPDALQEFRQGNFERAVQICRDEIAVNPRNMDSYVVMGWSLLNLGRYEEAMRYATTARSINRFDNRIIQILGEAHFHLGNNSEALRLFQEYINIAPTGQRVDVVYYLMGEIYIRTGKFRHADIALSTAVHWRPGNATWWTRLGFARENAGELIGAVTAYERALALNPQIPDARRGLDRVRQTLVSR